MTSNTRRIIFYLVAGGMLLAGSRTNAQTRREIPERGMQNLVSFESNLIGSDSTAARVDIVFRVRYDFFVFTHPFGEPSDRFTANGELGVEVLDTNDTPVTRDIKTIRLQSETSSPASLKKKYYQGASTFSLAPGKYKLIYHVDDKQSERHFRDDHRMLFIPPFHKKNIVRSSPVFVEPVEHPSSSSTFSLLNLGNGTYLGKNTGILLSVTQPPEKLRQDSVISVHYEIVRIGNDESPRPEFHEVRQEEESAEKSLAQNDTTLNALFFAQSDVAFVNESVHTVSYRFVPHNGTNWIYGVLHTEQLPQGRYLLKIHFDGDDTTKPRSAVVSDRNSATQQFSVRWLDMPQSLTNLELAVKAMQYITTDSEYDRLQSGNRTARIKAFEDFWKQRDPTPATAYNEMMAEYFRRVDYAVTAFGTLKEADGAFTDRGKVYILNGAPSHIERFLQPNSIPKEVWTYDSQKKKFYFEDPSRQGNYKLVLVENSTTENQK